MAKEEKWFGMKLEVRSWLFHGRGNRLKHGGRTRAGRVYSHPYRRRKNRDRDKATALKSTPSDVLSLASVCLLKVPSPPKEPPTVHQVFKCLSR